MTMTIRTTIPRLMAGSLCILAACSASNSANETPETSADTIDSPTTIPLNEEAGRQVLYELQVRSANACLEYVGTEDQRRICREKASKSYSVKGLPESWDVNASGDCSLDSYQKNVRLGTLDDMLTDTDDFRKAISLRYIKDRVGASVIWLMPLFPNNDKYTVPWKCDTLGSPYAVRDYMHVSGRVANRCNEANRDEYSDDPCWADSTGPNEFGEDAMTRFIREAHKRGLKVMHDLALNHFGHNYNFYNMKNYRSIRDRVNAKEDLGALWDYEKSFDANLLNPEILDRASFLPHNDASLDALKAKCPKLQGDKLVRSYNAWR